MVFHIHINIIIFWERTKYINNFKSRILTDKRKNCYRKQNSTFFKTFYNFSLNLYKSNKQAKLKGSLVEIQVVNKVMENCTESVSMKPLKTKNRLAVNK